MSEKRKVRARLAAGFPAGAIGMRNMAWVVDGKAGLMFYGALLGLGDAPVRETAAAPRNAQWEPL